MSVGLQRLREEPDVIRRGAVDKGEDPSIVDSALEVDATRRRLQAESDQLKAERNSASKQVGEAIRSGAKPDGPEVAALKAQSTAAGLKPGRAFRALYLAFLGRPNGPRAGWLLAKLEQDFVEGRLRDAAVGGTLPA